MAELILTDEEKAMPFWRDLDDANLGKVIKKELINLETQKEENFARTINTIALSLICTSLQVNADTAKYSIDGVTYNGEPAGDWVVTVRRSPRPLMPLDFRRRRSIGSRREGDGYRVNVTMTVPWLR